VEKDSEVTMSDEAQRLELRAANLIALNDEDGARVAMAAADEAAKPKATEKPKGK